MHGDWSQVGSIVYDETGEEIADCVDPEAASRIVVAAGAADRERARAEKALLENRELRTKLSTEQALRNGLERRWDHRLADLEEKANRALAVLGSPPGMRTEPEWRQALEDMFHLAQMYGGLQASKG